MGGLILKAVSKTGNEWLQSNASSLLEIGAKTIDGPEIAQLGEILSGKKCIMVVNVATKWGLTDLNYKEMV